MKIALTGSSGFIGQKLIPRLQSDGHTIQALPRHGVSAEALAGCEAVIHLAGEPVAQRWNAEVKEKIRSSRTMGTRSLVDAIASLSNPPKVLVSASAIGYYGDRGEETLTENSVPGPGFLPEVCVEWEQESRRAGALGLRVAMLRIGIVLGKEGGALKQMLPAFRAGLGGPLGSGKQWMSWIHVDDLVSLFTQTVLDARFQGALNAVAPQPIRNQDFAKTLGAALHRPAVLPLPEFALKLLFGEMAGIMLASQRVLPQATEASGFKYRYPDLRQAFDEVTA